MNWKGEDRMETAEQGTSGGFCSPFLSFDPVICSKCTLCVCELCECHFWARPFMHHSLLHTHTHICSLAQGDERHFSRFSVERRYTYWSLLITSSFFSNFFFASSFCLPHSVVTSYYCLQPKWCCWRDTDRVCVRCVCAREWYCCVLSSQVEQATTAAALPLIIYFLMDFLWGCLRAHKY